MFLPLTSESSKGGEGGKEKYEVFLEIHLQHSCICVNIYVQFLVCISRKIRCVRRFGDLIKIRMYSSFLGN